MYPNTAVIVKQETYCCNFMKGVFTLQGYVGFLWRFSIYNNMDYFPDALVVCNTVIQTNCLWDCDYQYYYNETCLSCVGGCTNCRNSYDCNLCINALCSSCNYYDTCSGCKDNSTLINGSCACS